MALLILGFSNNALAEITVRCELYGLPSGLPQTTFNSGWDILARYLLDVPPERINQTISFSASARVSVINFGIDFEFTDLKISAPNSVSPVPDIGDLVPVTGVSQEFIVINIPGRTPSSNVRLKIDVDVDTVGSGTCDREIDVIGAF